MDRLDYIAKQQGRLTVSGAPQGYDAYVAAQSAHRRGGPVLFVALDDMQADAAERAIGFFAPTLTVLSFPAWDCLPYDRVSSKPDIESRRLATLAALARGGEKPVVIVTTINALLQRVPPRSAIAQASFAARNGAEVDRDALVAFLAGNGYVRAGTVREPGTVFPCAAALSICGRPARNSRSGSTSSVLPWMPSAALMPRPSFPTRRRCPRSRCCPPARRH